MIQYTPHSTLPMGVRVRVHSHVRRHTCMLARSHQDSPAFTPPGCVYALMHPQDCTGVPASLHTNSKNQKATRLLSHGCAPGEILPPPRRPWPHFSIWSAKGAVRQQPLPLGALGEPHSRRTSSAHVSRRLFKHFTLSLLPRLVPLLDLVTDKSQQFITRCVTWRPIHQRERKSTEPRQSGCLPTVCVLSTSQHLIPTSISTLIHSSHSTGTY